MQQRYLLSLFPKEWKNIIYESSYELCLNHDQQNKCNPQRCLLAHFEATLDFSRSEFTAHNNISQICYYGQISLQSGAVNCSFSDNLKPLRVTFILLAMVQGIHQSEMYC